jgi:Ran GTPase-activating protein (RanGAP) involved in mRNA processing and transport
MPRRTKKPKQNKFINNESGLDLMWKNIKAEQAEQLATELSTNTTLLELVLASNNVGDGGAIAIANALGTNQTLTGLWLDNNNIGDEGIEALGHCLKLNHSLSKLIIRYNSVGTAGMISLADALKINNSLKELGMDSCSIDDEGAINMAKAIETNTTLTELDMQNNVVGENGALAILDALNEHNTTLTWVCLEGNSNISRDIHSEIYCVTSANHYGVRLVRAGATLDVSDKSICIRTTMQIAKELALNTTLKVLVLNRDTVTDNGEVNFASALATDRATWNENDVIFRSMIDDVGGSAIANALCKNASLQSLVLTGISMTVGAISKLLEVNSSLFKLAIGKSCVGDESAAAFADALKINSTITELDLANNSITDTGATALLLTLREHNRTLQTVNLSDNLSISQDLQRSIQDVLRFNSWLKRLRQPLRGPLKERIIPVVVQALHQRDSRRRRPRRAHGMKAPARSNAAAGIIFFLTKTAATKQTW